MALNFPNNPANGDVWTDTANGVEYTYNLTDDSWTGTLSSANRPINPEPSDVTVSPAFGNPSGTSPGSGTLADPYIITTSVMETLKGTAKSDQFITITKGSPGNQVIFLNNTTPVEIAGKFTQPVGMVDAEGKWEGYLHYNDNLGASTTADSSYTGNLQVGSTSVYFRWVVQQMVAGPIAVDTASAIPNNTNSALLGTSLTVTNPVISAGSAPYNYSYQWQTSSDGVSYTDKSGNAQSSYTSISEDVGKYIRCNVTVTDSAPIATQTISSASNAINIISLEVTPSIMSPDPGDTITANVVSSGGEQPETTTYQWYGNNSVIQGATNQSYTIPADKVGKRLSVKVTIVDNLPSTVEVTSVQTNSVYDPTPFNSEASTRFNPDDGAFLNRTLGDGNQQTWTMSMWIKRSGFGQLALVTAKNAGEYTEIFIDANNKLRVLNEGGNLFTSESTFFDCSAWYNTVFAYDSTQANEGDRIKVYVNGNEIPLGSGAVSQNYETNLNSNIPHYIGTYDKTSEFWDGYLADITFIDGQRLDASSFGKTDTATGKWIPKRYQGSYSGVNSFLLAMDPAEPAENYSSLASESGGSVRACPPPGEGDCLNAFRPEYIFDGYLTSMTCSNGLGTITTPFGKTFSGTRSFSVLMAPNRPGKETITDQDDNVLYTSTVAGQNWYTFSGTDVSALKFVISPEGNGGYWPIYSIAVDGVELVDHTAIGYDSSGSGNNWHENNLLAEGTDTDLLRDSPSDFDDGIYGTGNYCALNPLACPGDYSNGNLQVATSSTTNPGTIAVSSGKWYWEVRAIAVDNNDELILGIIYPGQITVSNYVGYTMGGYGYSYNGSYYNSDSSQTNVFSTYSTGSIIGVALDLDNYTLTFYNDGVAQPAQNIAAANYVPAISGAGSTNDGTAAVNFGQSTFTYPKPAGYSTLCTFNLPDPVLTYGDSGMQTVIYTGNGSGQSISSLAFEPGLTWIKARSDANGNGVNALFDQFRGNQMLSSDSSDNESSWNGANGEPLRGFVSSFDSNGFTLSPNNGSADYVCADGENYVAWNWYAGDSTVTVPVGSLSTELYDQRNVWSSFIVGSNNTTYPLSNCFGSPLNSDGIRANVGGVMEFDISSLNLTVGTVTLWPFLYKSPSVLSINDIPITNYYPLDPETGSAWYGPIIVEVNGPINTIKWAYDNSNGPFVYMRGIEFDGKLLLDNGVSIIAPSIETTVRANPETGFSIIKYTGDNTLASVASGLNSYPSMVITKPIDADSTNWLVWHEGFPNSPLNKSQILLNSPGVMDTYDYSVWGYSMTSTTIGVGTTIDTSGISDQYNNLSGVEYIGYCWSEVAGYSRFGRYDGANSPVFVWCGFKPAYLLIKKYNSSGNWFLLDTERNTFNPVNSYLMANLDNDEDPNNSTVDIQCLSNGFYVTGGSHGVNAPGNDFIFAAFASSPFKYSNAH